MKFCVLSNIDYYFIQEVVLHNDFILSKDILFKLLFYYNHKNIYKINLNYINYELLIFMKLYSIFNCNYVCINHELTVYLHILVTITCIADMIYIYIYISLLLLLFYIKNGRMLLKKIDRTHSIHNPNRCKTTKSSNAIKSIYTNIITI